MTTTIEVIDTAVKIGLGALISGITTYWVTNLKHKQDRQKEFSSKERLLLEEVAQQVEAINHVYLKYWALVVECVRYKSQGKEWPSERNTELESVKSEVFSSFKEITSAEAKLLLLGHNEACKLLRTLGEKIVYFRRHVFIEKKYITEEYIDGLKSEIKDIREQFFTSISDIYRKNIT